MKSWKTSLGAVIAAFGYGLQHINPKYSEAGAIITLVGTCIGLLFAADHSNIQSAINKNQDMQDAKPTTP